MTSAALAAALLLPVLAAPGRALDLSERSELRVRSPGDAFDFEQSARGELQLNQPRWHLHFGYEPHLAITSLTSDPAFDLLHTADLESQFVWRHARLTLRERAAYGTRSFTSLSPTTYDLVLTPGATRIVPIATSIRYGSAEASGTLGLTLSRRSELELSGGYVVEGGLNQRAKRVVPLVYGPHGGAAFRYQVARFDQLSTELDAESLYIDNASGGTKPRADVFHGLERWSHAWSRRTSSDLGGGAAFAERNPAPEDPRFYPIGLATLRSFFPTGADREILSTEGRAQVDVQIDRLTGMPDQRLNLVLDSNWTHAPYTLFGEAGRTQSLRTSEPNALTQYSGQLGLRYQWTKPLLVEAIYRAAYQTIDSPSTPAAALAAKGFNWVAILALQASAEPIRF